MKQCLPLTQNKEERGTWGLKAERVCSRCKLFSAAPLRRQVDMFLLISWSYKLLLQFKEPEWFNGAEKHFVESTVNLCFMFLCFSHKPTVSTGAVQRNVPVGVYRLRKAHVCGLLLLLQHFSLTYLSSAAMYWIHVHTLSWTALTLHCNYSQGLATGYKTASGVLRKRIPSNMLF